MAASLLFLNTDAKILDLIRTGNDEGLVMLYRANRKPILTYVLRNGGTEDDAEDLLQEALIVLWERIRAHRFEYNARLSTFVYATVKNIWRRRLARRRHESHADIEQDSGHIENATALDIMIESEEAQRVHRALEQLGEPCRTLLIMFYWEDRSMDDIATAMHFANAATAKSKKYQCKKALQRLLKERV
jgi:RNA polymerase sigma factor (sigma-70 family)